MKINSLRLRNFESHTDSSLALEKLNVIYGAEGSGKSSIINAIRVALCGNTPTNPVKDYVKHGAAEAVIDMEIVVDSGVKSLQRKIVDGKIENELMSRPQTLKAIGTNDVILKALIDSWHMTDVVDADDRRKIISDLLSQNINSETITNIIKTNSKVKDTAEVERLLTPVLTQCVASKSSNNRTLMDKITAAIKSCISTTSSQHSEAELLVNNLKQEIANITASIGATTTDNIEALAKSMSTITTARGEIAAKTEKLKTTRDEIQQLQDNIDKVDIALKDMNVEPLEKLNTEMAESNRMLDITKSQVAGIRAMLSKITNVTETVECPYIGECGYTDIKSKIVNIKENLNGTLALKIDLVTTKTNEIAILANKIGISEKYNNLQNAKTMCLKKMGLLESTASILSEEIHALQTNLDTIKVDDSDITRNVVALSTNLASSQKDLQAAEASIPTFIKNVVIYQDIYNTLTNTSLWFSENTTLNAFMAILTTLSSKLIPGSRVSVDADFEIKLNDTFIHTLSKSERFRIATAIQAALAIASNVGILIIDGIDIYSKDEAYSEILSKLCEIEAIKTIILTSTRELKVPIASAKVFRLKDGAIV